MTYPLGIPKKDLKYVGAASRDLRLAAGRGDLEALRLELCKPGIDLELKDEAGWTALTYAAHCGQVECLKALLEAGAAHSPYTNAAFSGGSQQTPLDLAETYSFLPGRPECVEILKAAGATRGVIVENTFEKMMAEAMATPEAKSKAAQLKARELELTEKN